MGTFRTRQATRPGKLCGRDIGERMGAGAQIASGRVSLGRKTGDEMHRSGRTGGRGPTFKNSFWVTIDFVYIFIYIGIYTARWCARKTKGVLMDNRQIKKRCVLCGGVPDEINLYKTRPGFTGFLTVAELCAGCAEALFLDDSDIIEETEGG